MIKLKSLLSEITDTELKVGLKRNGFSLQLMPMVKLAEYYSMFDDYEKNKEELEREWYSGQKHQSWKLIPSRDLILIWVTFAKYGRVDDDKIQKIWNTIKNLIFKLGINTDIWNGYDPEFFNKEDYDDITEEEWKKFSIFVSDRSGSKLIRNMGEIGIGGQARYSDSIAHLMKLLKSGYSVKNNIEELLVVIDKILNFVYGSGSMAKWFVEGGESTLNKIRDMDIKGIVVPSRLNEISIETIPHKFKNKGVVNIREYPIGDDFKIGKYYHDGDVLNYIRGQHPDFEEDDKVYGIFQCLEVNPKTTEESEFNIDDDKVKRLSQSTEPFPPIVLNKFGWIIDGGHRLEASKLRGDKKIKVLKQIT